MKKHVIIIGGGIVGSTAAFYLSQEQGLTVTLIDKGIGTATRAAAGIICPWLSQRRNKEWYALTASGASFYQQLMIDLQEAGIPDLPYQQTGTLVFKNKASLLEKLQSMATERRKTAKDIGDLSIWTGAELTQLIPPLTTQQGAILASGGGRVDGEKLLEHLQQLILKNGGQILKGEATLRDEKTVLIEEQELSFDHLLLACGAWLPTILSSLSYQVDIRPQKGQLLEIQTQYETESWPGCMLHGEIDILPFENGKLVIGATHEDDMNYDLTIDTNKIQAMKDIASQFIPAVANSTVAATRVGTRAYTSDFLPFYGNLADNPNIWVASGLGSSGLTSGPFIGWQLAQEIAGKNNPFNRIPYTPANYIKKES
ncbi:NAD(P)/FAD-dependent oxidoreductase [Streptococcus cameli]